MESNFSPATPTGQADVKTKVSLRVKLFIWQFRKQVTPYRFKGLAWQLNLNSIFLDSEMNAAFQLMTKVHQRRSITA